MHYKIGVTCVLYMNIDLKLRNKLHGPMHYKIGVTCVLYTNIDRKLRNKLHGPMHYKIGVTCVYTGHEIYTHLILQFHNSADRILNSGVSGQCSNTIHM